MGDSAYWMNKAALYEILALAFKYVSKDSAAVLVSGEYAEALQEVGAANGIDPALLREQCERLGAYAGQDEALVLHELRKEHTRLFIGPKNPAVIPYAGMWDSVRRGKQALFMVGPESMAIERVMRRCGIGQPEGTNEPLDHIASLLEFLYYLCLVKAGAVAPAAHASVREADCEEFFNEHFRAFAHAFARGVLENTEEPLLTCAARVLLQLEK